MKFASVNGEEVHILGTHQDRDSLLRLVQAANESVHNLETYCGVSAEQVSDTLEELGSGKSPDEIVVSKSTLNNIYALIGHIRSVGMHVEKVAHVSDTDFETIEEDIDTIHAAVFPEAREGPY